MEAVARALAAIEARNGAINAFTAVLERRARATAARARRGPPRRRALRGEEPLRRKGPRDARRLENQSRLAPAKRDAP
jgi:hypothetical protein